MVTLMETKTNLKSPLRLDRQQQFRGSKRFKRQAEVSAEFTLCSNNSSKQVSPLTSSTGPSLQLLACYEDPSFIYHHTSSLNIPSSFSASDDSLASPASSTTSSSSLVSSNSSGCRLSRPLVQVNGLSDYYSSEASSSSCVSALDYCHLSSSSYTKHKGRSFAVLAQRGNQTQSKANGKSLINRNNNNNLNQAEHAQCNNSSNNYYNNNNTTTPDPVYLEDDELLFNLLLKETAEIKRRQLVAMSRLNSSPGKEVERKQEETAQLTSHLRHSLLSWMLKICEHQNCQDEIFPLSTMILDKFLLLHQPANELLTLETTNKPEDKQPEEEEINLCCGEDLKMRQLYLFAACSLLLATKLRQTPRLCVQTLIEFSKDDLPVELSREEILDGELLILVTLKWDLASLVTPNDFLSLLLVRCQQLLSTTTTANEEETCKENGQAEIQVTTTTTTTINKRCDESRVRRHTQTLLELCLMDSHLSQYPPSILAASSMAVAIDGLGTSEKSCLRLKEIVAQIHKAAHRMNELEVMIDVASQIETYVQKLLNSTNND